MSAGPRGGVSGIVAGGIAAAAIAATVAVSIPVVVTDAPGYTGSLNPFRIAAGLATGAITWTTTCTLIAAAEAVPFLAAAAWAGRRLYARARKRHHPDRVARRLARPGDLEALTPGGVAASAKRLRAGLDDDDPDAHGVLIGRTVVGDVELRQSWEDMATDIWGPRTGKTSARAIPAIVAAPGPVIVTSRKGDIVDATRGPRETDNRRVWVFDPQSMLDQPQSFWCDFLAPLKAAAGTGTMAVTAARRLASHFTFTGADAKTDAYFGPKSDDLVANFLLAAAVAPDDEPRSLLDCYIWSTRPRDTTPAELLEAAGFDLPAKAVYGTIALPDKTRGGVYGGAEKALTCLTEPATAAWVTPPATGVELRQFRPEKFVRSLDTLYLLTEAGPGSPAPVIAAFVDSVYRAGEVAARTMPGRRLEPPCLSILDEAANICKIGNLPNLYSFYGSAGLPIVTILQSFSQGVGVWGKDGMQALWSASNIRVLGGGVSDPEFLKNQSDLIGVFDEEVRSVTSSPGSPRSVNRSVRERPILRPSDLTAMPRTRMVVLPSGARPALIKSQGWWDGPHADAVNASLDQWDPDRRRAELATSRDDPHARTEFDDLWTAGDARR